ncbi:MAG: hypothetical protein AVO33_01140 [delta proteobacterium ML8_F1]|nr:MAG: hypothetical protein AVO33_01140 [delta proteobacterium ML8_F1]
MKIYRNHQETVADVTQIIQDASLTYEQQTLALAKLAENQLPLPVGEDEEILELFEKGIICDLDEGHGPYAPRYILPDYEKFFAQGSQFLRLEPPKNLLEAIQTLQIFYHHVPSITRFPVYLGRIDKLLDPFITDREEAREQIKWFLIHLDRTINDSFSHANVGPEETVAGTIIIDLIGELQNVTPNLTILYDKEKTSEAFALSCVTSSLVCANPAFASDRRFRDDFGDDYGIASCYNGLPTGGGAFTLSRLRLNRIVDEAASREDFFASHLPRAVDALLRFMESKIKFLAEETPFFTSNFLVKEGFVDLDRFVGLFGLVGMDEAVDNLMKKEGRNLSYGIDREANELALDILDFIQERVGGFTSGYGKVWGNHFLLHSQVGAAGDEGTTPGMRIAIDKDMPLYDHLRQAAQVHPYFPSGIGDHFPFDYTAKENPQAVLDIFKGGFESGMRYISAYSEDGDIIRVTGYLVKKSDLEKFNQGEQISYDTIQYAKEPLEKHGILNRKVVGVND